VAIGRPEEVAGVEGSHTGQWLRTVLPTWDGQRPSEAPPHRGIRVVARAGAEARAS
jgi:hypothetical protein